MRGIQTKRPKFIGDVIVIILILTAAVLTAFFMAAKPSLQSELIVIITVNGEYYAEMPLDGTVRSIPVYGGGDILMCVETDGRGVRAVGSSCPNLDCCRMGYVYEAGNNIACLPNRVLITIEGVQEKRYDAEAGA